MRHEDRMGERFWQFCWLYWWGKFYLNLNFVSQVKSNMIQKSDRLIEATSCMLLSLLSKVILFSFTIASKHRSSYLISEVRIVRSLVFYLMFCITLFILLSFYFWHYIVLELQFLIVPLLSSNLFFTFTNKQWFSVLIASTYIITRSIARHIGLSQLLAIMSFSIFIYSIFIKSLCFSIDCTWWSWRIFKQFVFFFCRFLFTDVIQKHQYRRFIQKAFVYNKTLDDSLNKQYGCFIIYHVCT